MVRARQAAGATGVEAALRRHAGTDPAPHLAREELLRQPLLDEVPREDLVHADLAGGEELRIVRPAGQGTSQIAALAVRELEEIGAAAVAPRHQRLQPRLARAEELDPDAARTERLLQQPPLRLETTPVGHADPLERRPRLRDEGIHRERYPA